MKTDIKKDTIVEIFSDGACSGNPGPGGYGAILRYGDAEEEISGYAPDTTNNRMELLAVIEALRKLKRPARIRVFTDSNYLVKGMTEWLPGWIKRGWINSQKKPVQNRDLWESLVKLSQGHDIKWQWIRGHAGHPENERCDELARKAIQGGGAKASVMTEDWQTVLGNMTYGIYVLTAAHGNTYNGMIASWVTQVSYAPPMVMAAVHPDRYTHALIEEGQAFALHILSKDQKDFLKRFKGMDPAAKFKGLGWSYGVSGCPILEDCLAYIESRVVSRIKPGNHTLYIGEVLNCRQVGEGRPFHTLDYEGTYTGKA